MAKIEEAENKREILFSKKQLINSEKFVGYQDILSALLEDGKEYSVEAAARIVDNYLKGKVK